MNVSIFGTGYVGLVTGVCLSKLGHKVTCIDIDGKKIEKLKNGDCPIYETGLEELLVKNLKNINFTTDFKKSLETSEVIFIAVGTPAKKDGTSNLEYVEEVAKTISDNIKSFKVIIIKSTVPVGTGDCVEQIIARKYKGEIAVVSNPEFLKEGTAVADFFYPDRIIIGTNNQKAIKIINKLYQKLDAPTFITDRKSSELIKYASNSFLATKISFINSIANIAEESGADINAISEGMGLDKRIGPHFLKAGIGYGGSCFPKDVQALIHSGKKYGIKLDLLEAVERVNNLQKEKAVKILEKNITLKNATVGILGLSFKPNTDDLREAPSLAIIKSLLEKGAKIRAFDPISESLCAQIFPNVHYCPSPYEAVENADAAIVVTEWDILKKMDIKKIKKMMKNPLIVDGRNIFDKQKVKDAGIKYFGIGR